ncbi:glycine zipper 2TM domain-containing protein [Sulfuricurvum sp.]|uniref:glycine zipper 2TM domain-containing protein n=1 Tax=Sulfuricurvum sp. TaxID=2025608 RepID=UPI003562215F
MKKLSFPIALFLSSCMGLHAANSVFIDGQEYVPVQRDTASPQQTAVPYQTMQHEECWYEQVPINGTYQGGNSPNTAGAIVGGVIGGVIGHQFGRGGGNAAATIGGAVLGTAIGANSGTRQTEPQYQLIRKCNIIR